MPGDPARKPAGLSVFFPAYNDSGTIASMVIRAVQAASELTPDFEVIIVNDGSSDATAAIADELERTYPNVRVVHHPRNRGSSWRAHHSRRPTVAIANSCNRKPESERYSSVTGLTLLRSSTLLM